MISPRHNPCTSRSMTLMAGPIDMRESPSSMTRWERETYPVARNMILALERRLELDHHQIGLGADVIKLKVANGFGIIGTQH